MWNKLSCSLLTIPKPSNKETYKLLRKVLLVFFWSATESLNLVYPVF